MFAVPYMAPYFHSILMFGYGFNKMLNKNHILMVSHMMTVFLNDIFQLFVQRVQNLKVFLVFFGEDSAGTPGHNLECNTSM